MTGRSKRQHTLKVVEGERETLEQALVANLFVPGNNQERHQVLMDSLSSKGQLSLVINQMP